MPELPEIEARVQELDPLVARAPVEKAGPAHIATLKTFDPPLAALAERRLQGAARRGKNLLFPTADGELVLRVHLMSAGRLRYHAAGAKTPKSPMFRLRFADGGELVLTEAGKKKRAGVWLSHPRRSRPSSRIWARRARDRPERLAEVLRRERRQLHPSLRDQRALTGIGRKKKQKPWLTRLSPFRLSISRMPRSSSSLRIYEDLERALVLRLKGKNDAAVYRVHGHFGEPGPRCGTTLRRVDFEEHTITDRPTCQTGKELGGPRRLSRLLR